MTTPKVHLQPKLPNLDLNDTPPRPKKRSFGARSGRHNRRIISPVLYWSRSAESRALDKSAPSNRLEDR